MTRAGAALALLLALLCLPGAALPAGAEVPEDMVRLDLLFTNDVQGYIEPCG